MNKKDDQKLKIILNLLPILILIAMVLGCGGTNQQVANKPDPAPASTPTDEKTPEKEVAEKSPAEPFYGNWETKDPTTGQFERWKLGTAEKEGSEYVGRITNLETNVNLGKYRVGTSDKSVTLELSKAVGQGSLTYDYEIAPDGNTITLKGANPIVFKRGTANADVLKDVETFYSGVWKMDDAAANSLNLTPPVNVVFERANKYDEGYGGVVRIFEIGSQNVIENKYTISSKNNITIADKNGSKKATYELLNNGNILKIDYEDPGSSDLFLTKN